MPGHSGNPAGRPTGIAEVPKDLQTLIKYVAEGGLMIENPDDKNGDPVYISHLVLATMLKGIKGELVQRETTTETDRGTTTTPLPRQLMIARYGLGVTIWRAAVAQTVR